MTLLVPQAVMATGTRAGTLIDNTATATYDPGSGPVTVNSNLHSLKVDELIDTTVAWSDSADVVTTPGATSQVLKYQVTNTGNGVETFGLSTVANIGGDQYDPSVTSIVIDDGDGVYEPGIDTVYVAGAGDLVLNPDQSITVFVVSTTPSGVVDGDRGGVRLVATSKTGTGAPGTSFAGAGEGGGNAVIGATGGDGENDGFYLVSSATVALVKSAKVIDPFGGTTSVPGSRITYTIIATTTGTGSLSGLSISDAVPTGTTYFPGSITLGGVVQSDAADTDAGSFASNIASVVLGTVAGGQTRTVTFQVTIN
ncbi:MAG: hypothetical protein ABL874_07130 [Sphingopyxis sp.]